MKEVIQVRRAAEGRKGLGLKPHETSLSLVDRLCQAQCDVGFLGARNNNGFHSYQDQFLANSVSKLYEGLELRIQIQKWRRRTMLLA